MAIDMQITVKQLRRLIRESLTKFDPGGMPSRSYPTEPVDAFPDHPDYKAGVKDASRGVEPPENASDEYHAGYDSAMEEW